MYESEADLWYIASMSCDGEVFDSWMDYTPGDPFTGSCNELGDSDVQMFWQFFMGMACYPQYTDLLLTKAKYAMTAEYSGFDHFPYDTATNATARQEVLDEL